MVKNQPAGQKSSCSAMRAVHKIFEYLYFAITAAKSHTKTKILRTIIHRALGLIARTLSYKNQDILLKLYKTLVRPHLEYCVSVWSPYYEKDKILLERVQHRFTRLIPGFKQLTYMERLRRLRLWTLEERRNLSLIHI